MKLKKLIFCMAAGIMTLAAPVKAHAHEHTHEINKSTLRENVNIPVLFKEDAVVKDSSSLSTPLETKVQKYTKAVLEGGSVNGEAKVDIDGKTYYVSPNVLAVSGSEQDALLKQQEEEKKAKEEADKKAKAEKEKQEKEAAEKARQQELAGNWTGPRLTRSAGVVQGPSGRETYYNLPMNGVVNIMRSMGNTDPYWVRADGCKMLGDYIMVAANLGIRPRGSLIPTSLGMGIVCDTGGFAAVHPYGLDIATAW